MSQKIKKKNANIHYWDKYKILRNTTINEIRRSKKDYYDKLEDMLTSEKPNSKLFWKTSKQLLKIGKISQNVPTLKLNDEFAETDLQKAEMLNKYFASQSYVNDDNKVLPQPTDVLHDPLYLFTITPQNTKDVLDNLDASKSCGPDLMSPRLLKEGSSILATPYSI